MAQSLARILVHVIFSTKQRRPMITDDVRAELNSYIAGALRNLGSPALIVESVEDHLHAMFSLSRNYSISKVIEEIKKESSKWMKTKGPAFETFYWQN